jgi:serine/threonine protein kinase
MGVVYLAPNTLMGRDEVLKVMGRQIIERPGVLDRFLREIRAVARLRHVNIVTAYAAFRLGDSIVFAMEYVDGLDLSRLVKAKGPLPVAHACSFVYQAALGLQHAHDEGLVHRDIKPHNLMLARKGDRATVKILDFGLAKVAREEKVDSGLTSQGQALGTPDYIAPEQILDAVSADIRADIYSLGDTLYYLLTARPPFKANSLYDIYQAHISREADPLNLVSTEVPVELASVVARMMAKDPAERFQTPGEVAKALTPFMKKASGGSASGQFQAVPPPAATPPVPGASSSVATPAKPPAFGPEQPSWDSLIDLREKEGPAPAPLPEAPDATPQGQSRRWWVGPAAGVGLVVLGFLLFWAVVTLRVKTQDGMIVLENVPEHAEILIDGAKVKVQWPEGRGPLEVTVPAGRHQIEVKKPGFRAFGQDLAIATGQKAKLLVRLEGEVKPEPRSGTAATLTTANPEPLAERPLLNGFDFQGWSGFLRGKKAAPLSVFSIAGSEITNVQGPIAYISTDRAFTNFTLALQFRSQAGNGGILLVPAPDPSHGWGAIECLIKADETGSLDTSLGRTIAAPLHGQNLHFRRKLNTELPARQWNNLEIRCEAATVVVRLNGQEVNSLACERPVPLRIGIRRKPGGTIQYRNIRLSQVENPRGAAGRDAHADGRKSLLVSGDDSYEEPTAWAWTTTDPGADWTKPDFDDRAWKRGAGAFGGQGTRAIARRTGWNTRQIWLRTVIDVPRLSPGDALALHLFHDEGVEVFVNGKSLFRADGWMGQYRDFPLNANQVSLFQPGRNTIAVTCKHTGGGKGIDVGLRLFAAKR